MRDKLSRQDLIELVGKIIDADGTEAELDEWQRLVEVSVPDPNVSDLIFYPDMPMTPEQIVDRALVHRPLVPGIE